MAKITPQRLNVAPFSDVNLYELGLRKNLPELRRIVGQLSGPGFAVVDGWSQSVVDDARRRFDSCVGGDPKRSALHNVLSWGSYDGEGVGQIAEQLLSIGMDPDLSTGHGWRPSHSCASFGYLRAGRAVLLCRPDMEATNPNGNTPRGAAAKEEYEGEDKVPHRKAGRLDLLHFIDNERLEIAFDALPELAVRQVWFAILNLVRRQVVPESEYEEKAYGKKADEWAEYFGQKRIAEEIRYYASLPSAKLLDAKEKIENFENEVDDLKDQLKRQQIRASSEREAAAAKAKAESDALGEQLKGLEERCAAFETKNGELSETLATLTSSRSPGRTSELSAKEPAAKRPKLETAGSALRSGEDEPSNAVE